MVLRIGISRSLRRLRAVCESLEAPTLISAGSLWDAKRRKLRKPVSLLGMRDLALDSAGFSAMTHWGGEYPWTAREYAELAAWLQPTWWAHRDYCVEPELISDEAHRQSRIDATVRSGFECCEVADEMGIPRPMPVLQGWTPADYLRCAEAMQPLPQLVGVGSVCRRHMHGPDGLIAIVDALSTLGVDLHLFGVKGTALRRIRTDMFLAGAVHSADSHAWDYACRMQGVRTLDGRMEYLREWYSAQV